MFRCFSRAGNILEACAIAAGTALVTRLIQMGFKKLEAEAEKKKNKATEVKS